MKEGEEEERKSPSRPFSSPRFSSTPFPSYDLTAPFALPRLQALHETHFSDAVVREVDGAVYAQWIDQCEEDEKRRRRKRTGGASTDFPGALVPSADHASLPGLPPPMTTEEGREGALLSPSSSSSFLSDDEFESFDVEAIPSHVFGEEEEEEEAKRKPHDPHQTIDHADEPNTAWTSIQDPSPSSSRPSATIASGEDEEGMAMTCRTKLCVPFGRETLEYLEGGAPLLFLLFFFRSCSLFFAFGSDAA